MRKTLFLNPPSFEGFDGGAGARYQARREVRSFWFPTWLAQPAAMVEGSRLVDAPPADLELSDVLPMAADFELCVIHTSTPSFESDIRTAAALKEVNPRLEIGFIGPHVATLPEPSLEQGLAVDWVARHEFDFTVKEIAEGRPLEEVDGVSFRRDGKIVHTKDRTAVRDMDELPHVIDVYHRDLRIEDYEIGEALYPFISLYTGRGCKSRCTFCLWPQTIGGHDYRVRSAQHVYEEIAKAVDWYPQLREFFFDDDTLTDKIDHVEGIARRIGPLLQERGMTWSCNAKANVPTKTLELLKDNGLRLMTVGYETGNQQILNNIKKGMRLEFARRFTEDCHRLGIKIHGTFIMGLPGETKETIQETIRFAKELNPTFASFHRISPYHGTPLYDGLNGNARGLFPTFSGSAEEQEQVDALVKQAQTALGKAG